MQDDPTASLSTAAAPGFLNKYSMQGVEEDKAELFAYLMVEPDYVSQRARDDSVLASKVTALKTLLHRFCPSVRDDFWKGPDMTPSSRPNS